LTLLKNVLKWYLRGKLWHIVGFGGMKRLAGEYFNTLDEKGRISFPAKLRGDLPGNSLFVTKALDKCLWLFAPEEWEKVRESIEGKASLFSQDFRLVSRVICAPAVEVEFDKSGRLLVPPTLREYAALSKDCVILGLGNYIELWDAAAYKQYMDDNADSLAKAAEELGAIGF